MTDEAEAFHSPLLLLIPLPTSSTPLHHPLQNEDDLELRPCKVNW